MFFTGPAMHTAAALTLWWGGTQLCSDGNPEGFLGANGLGQRHVHHPWRKNK